MEQFYKLTPGEALVLRVTSRRNYEANMREGSATRVIAERANEKLYNPIEEAPGNLTRADWQLIREALAENVMTRRAIGTRLRVERLEELLRKLDSE